MDYFYNKVFLAYKQRMPVTGSIKINSEISSKGILYPTTGGESSHIEGRTLAIDGMANVIDFLELLENEEIEYVDFLELRACDESCAGGILSHRNRFLAAETMRKYAAQTPDSHKLVDEYKKYTSAVIHMEQIEPRSMVKYDWNIEIALQKMEKARELRDLFPGIDCGACGAPSCEALAEDIAKGQGEISSCIFLRTIYEKRGELGIDEAVKIMERIWGDARFDKD